MMKVKLFKLIMRLIYKNLSRGEYGCPRCRESAQSIFKLLEERKRIVIALNPALNCSDYFMSYHITELEGTFYQAFTDEPDPENMEIRDELKSRKI